MKGIPAFCSRWPLPGTFAHSLTMGADVVPGLAIELAAFPLLFPVDGNRRMQQDAKILLQRFQPRSAAM